jgi:hypothetical protein
MVILDNCGLGDYYSRGAQEAFSYRKVKVIYSYKDKGS